MNNATTLFLATFYLRKPESTLQIGFYCIKYVKKIPLFWQFLSAAVAQWPSKLSGPMAK